MENLSFEKNSTSSEILLYQTEDGKSKIEVRLEYESVWVTQIQMAALFQTTKQNIGQHIKNILQESELKEDSVVKNFFITASDGKNYRTRHYNLDMIINEIRQLNRIVTMYLDYAEMQAERRQPIYMKEWKEKSDAFLSFNEKEILNDAGRISMEVAKNLAVYEYEKFNQKRLAFEAQQDDEDFEQIARQIEKRKAVHS